MTLQRCFSISEDIFPLPQNIKQKYGPFGFPPARDTTRPYVSSNFVMGLDGRVSFRELPGRAGGKEVSRSREDRWLLDFVRVHHDAQLMGASTLREERGADGLGWDYGIEDQELRTYRQDVLHLGASRILILTGSGDIDFRLRVFHSSQVEPWLVTAAAGEKIMKERLRSADISPKIVTVGEGSIVDIPAALRVLKHEHGIGSIVCEGGPALYGQLLQDGLVDEEFRTLSLQVLGTSTKPDLQRPTAYGNASFMPETAPWFRLISLHYALPHHAFVRVRYEGPRKF